MKRIQLLPLQLANQIAAGEVIERPASVLKEILENSLDAGSTHIDITIEKGGIGLIRVQDNGVGICKEDLQLALTAHATSKIQTLADLEGVNSYGFRGEALASIASVSKLQLSSGVSHQETAFNIVARGREGVSVPTPIPKQKGTCIEIRDLFYNTPARRKFLRSAKTEAHYTEEVFKRIALSQPKVVFNFRMDNRSNKRLPACLSLEAQTRRVANLCGKAFIENAYYIQAEANNLKLLGWLGSPKALRAQADLQYFYVNSRIVRDKVVMHAIRQAYSAFSALGRFPAYVLFFELDPNAVDVNVHPTKHEVRFREARTVHAFLTYAVQEGLKFDNPNKTNLSIDLPVDRLQTDIDKSNHLPQTIETIVQTQNKILPHIKPLTLLGGKFLILEQKHNNEYKTEPELMIADIKKIHKEILCTRLLFHYNTKNIASKPLLFPKILTIGEIVEKIEHLPWEAKRLGFEWDQLGPTSIVLRNLPMEFNGVLENLQNATESLAEFISTLLQSSTPELAIEKIASFIANIYVLSLEEAFELFKDAKFYKKFTLDEIAAIL